MEQAASRPRYPLRAWIAFALILAALLMSQLALNVGLVQKLPSAIAIEKLADSEKSYAEARKFLPRFGVIGYLSDPPDSKDVTRDLYNHRYYSTESLLAPLVITDSVEPQIILGNFFSPHAVEKAVAEHKLVVVHDFHNGVFIFRKEGS